VAAVAELGSLGIVSRMRYLIAFLIFVSGWFVSVILFWFVSGLFSPIRHDEVVVIGWGDDWRNRAGNIVAAILAVSLVVIYLRRAKKKVYDLRDA
jgi:hypothetical protein